MLFWHKPPSLSFSFMFGSFKGEEDEDDGGEDGGEKWERRKKKRGRDSGFAHINFFFSLSLMTKEEKGGERNVECS